MTTQGQPLEIAYLHYGAQSGVTPQISAHLTALGHRITPLQVPGPLEPRDARGRRRWSWPLAAHLAVSALRFGSRAIAHRWNTTYAFDAHSARAASLIQGLPRPPDVILQNGALFAPGLTPVGEYVLLLDHTRALSMQRPPMPEAGLPPPVDYGAGWRERETALYRGARAIATFSRQVAESLQVDYGVDGSRIHVVGAGANVHPEHVVRADDGATLLFVGKDFRRKGGLVLLRAFERLRRDRPRLRLLIAGPNEPLMLPAGATNLGPVPPERLAALFSTATVFVLPTLREPFGLAYLDAMACGLPCVGTAVEAVPEIIEHGGSGLLVPPGDDMALTATIARLLDDPAQAHAMGLRGRLRVDAQFRWHQVAERLELALRGEPDQAQHAVVA